MSLHHAGLRVPTSPQPHPHLGGVSRVNPLAIPLEMKLTGGIRRLVSDVTLDVSSCGRSFTTEIPMTNTSTSQARIQ